VTEGDSRKRSLGNGGPTKKKARKVPEKEEENISVAAHHPGECQRLSILSCWLPQKAEGIMGVLSFVFLCREGALLLLSCWLRG
jgi:hypothetical protein